MKLNGAENGCITHLLHRIACFFLHNKYHSWHLLSLLLTVTRMCAIFAGSRRDERLKQTELLVVNEVLDGCYRGRRGIG